MGQTHIEEYSDIGQTHIGVYSNLLLRQYRMPWDKYAFESIATYSFHNADKHTLDNMVRHGYDMGQTHIGVYSDLTLRQYGMTRDKHTLPS
jgi:hypothetical protein